MYRGRTTHPKISTCQRVRNLRAGLETEHDNIVLEGKFVIVDIVVG